MKEVKVLFESFTVNQNMLYFAEYRFNAVFSYNLLTEELQLISVIEEEKMDGTRLFSEIIYDNNCLYLIPFYARNVYKINLLNKSVTPVYMELSNKKSEKDLKVPTFSSARLYNNHIYMFSSAIPTVVEYSTITGKVTYYNNWWNEKDYILCPNETAFFRKTYIYQNIIYAPLCKTNAVLKMNLDDKSIEMVKVGERNKGFSGICFDGSDFWLCPRKDDVITKWNEDNEEVQYYNIKEENTYNAADIVCVNKQIWMLPVFDDYIYKMEDNCMQRALVNQKGQWCSIFVSEGIIYIFVGNESKLYEINYYNEIKEKELYYPIEIQRGFCQYLSSINSAILTDSPISIINEDYCDNLMEFIRYVRSIK